MNDMNSGYVGYSMSVRANEAYKNGENPKSQWAKSDILCELKNEYSEELFEQIKKYPVKCLKEVFLFKSSWHHTSSYVNCTDFYTVNAIDDDSVIEMLEASKPQPKQDELQYVRFSYLEWLGTRKHPKAYDREAVGILKGNWIYFKDGKKNLSTKGVKILVAKDTLRGNAFTSEEKEMLKKLNRKGNK